MAKTTDERLDHVERVLDDHTTILSHHSALLEALNETAARQTDHLAAIVAQLQHMNEGIIRALSAALRLDALDARLTAVEQRR
jgi:hypothetical protein